MDRFYAGMGNDTIVLTASDVTNLANNTAGGPKALVSGGGGFDTIRMSGGAALDLTAISNAGAMGQEENSRIESVERIDLATDTAANTLTLSGQDVKDMSDMNSIHLTTISDDGKTWTNVGAGSALGATTKFHQLVVNGTSSDTLNLQAGNGFWFNAGEVSDGTTNYYVYQSTATNSQVVVNKTVTVNNNDTTPAGDTMIDLGASGRLIAPVLVEGKWYYYWDRSGDGTTAGTDTTTNTVLNGIFQYDSNGTLNPNAGTSTTDVYRYATINGVRVALPTVNGGLSYPQGLGSFQNGTAATTGGTSIPFDELLAIWDTNNGTGLNASNGSSMNSGIPSGWAGNAYLSATPYLSGHVVLNMAYGDVKGLSDSTVNFVALQVLPVVLDLNRDGVLSYGQVTMDVNGDGHLDATKWAGAGDGVLVWDKYADGLVHDNSQYAFAQYATTYANGLDAQGKAPTDLSGLAEAFDSNHDSMFDAQDEKFAEFKVWQDANQNGVSDAGEVRSLAEWGITSINLISDGVVRTPAAGVTEAGQTTATATDGSSVLVSDAGFEYQSLAYSAETVNGLGAHIDLLGSGMNLNLANCVALHGKVEMVDLTGTGANTFKLGLQDVLQGCTSGSLTVTGNADDTVLFNASEWLNTGDVVLSNGHNFAVYYGGNGCAAQLLIDQHVIQQSL